MCKRIICLVLILMPLNGIASHIVGGEFELVHLRDFQYRLNLVLYFDVINGDPRAKDPSVTARIFRIRDNAIILDVFLPLISEAGVSYTQPECSNGEIVTNKLIYSSEITLSQLAFNDPQGYYIVWERCCRNYSITNIFSEDPGFGTNYAGQTFYLEFPPVVKDGQPFVDSTPRLFPPLNDYACPGRPYYADFKGTDDDGDSLVYSLVAPLNTKSADALPLGGPRPRPYPPVKYRTPYGPTNILNGNPDLRISNDGFLTVTPSSQGLFVFAVRVEEYREGVKIGETRRDFQMLVVDGCARALPPQIEGKKLSDASYIYDNTMSVFFASNTPDNNRCVMVRVSDEDATFEQDGFQERVKIKAIPLNFKGDASITLPAEVTAVLDHGSTAEFRICFPECPFFFGGPVDIGIVAMDDACSLPLTDTLKISVLVEPPPNSPPRFTSTNPVNSTLNEGDQVAWPYSVVDDDGDTLVVSLLTDGFVLANAGMTFTTFNNVPGAANGQLKWDAYCNIYDFTQRTNFQVTVMVEDNDQCKIPSPVKAIYNLGVILPGNADPIIDTDLTAAASERDVSLQKRINDRVQFTVTGKDLTDNDLLILNGGAQDFAPSQIGMTISSLPVTNRGTTQAQVSWDIACESINLDQQDSLNFRFIVVDNANKCRLYKADTVDVHVKLLPPINQEPRLQVINQNAAEITLASDNSISLVRGPEINLQLTGFDDDLIPAKDNLTLTLIDVNGNAPAKGFVFEKATGTSPVTANFIWKPDCSAFVNGVYDNNYVFTFRLADDHCRTASADTLKVAVNLKDIDSKEKQFVPPNFFSPNGDNVNDYYSMEILDPDTGALVDTLPLDNCVSQFERVVIFNRWGKEVFSSTDRHFRWYGQDASPGVYYYSIYFSNREFRGTVTLRE